MSVKKLIAIAVIFILTFVAWMILGVSNLTRTDKSFQKLRSEVISLYGDALVINAPDCYSKIKKYKEEIIDGKKIKHEYFETENFELSKSEIKININLDQRKKGHLWFPTFKANFNGSYEFRVKNYKENKDGEYFIYSTLRSSNSIYNNIRLAINDAEITDVIPLIRK